MLVYIVLYTYNNMIIYIFLYSIHFPLIQTKPEGKIKWCTQPDTAFQIEIAIHDMDYMRLWYFIIDIISEYAIHYMVDTYHMTIMGDTMFINHRYGIAYSTTANKS